MKTSRLHGPRNLKLEDVSEPVINNDEVLIRVRAMGICGSDLHIYTGERQVPYPRILGHEFAGDIVKVGANVSHLRSGQRVTAEPNFWCGKCVFCLTGFQFATHLANWCKMESNPIGGLPCVPLL